MSLPSVNNYLLVEKIGSGSFATVYKAFKKDESRETVAIKHVNKSSLSKSAVDNLITEINLLKILKHEHIVEMKDFFWTEGHIYIVMEYCDGGDLSSFIKKRHKLPENICRRFLQQLALALRYLRNHNVCHMDLKPQNLLLVTKPQLTLKIPKTYNVSSECKDLLMSLLKHNPAERITFEEFLAHGYLDLEHAPTKENYEKAVTLVQKAIKMDTEKNTKEAFHLYCEALRYFIPILTNETDPKRKEILRTHVYDYIRHAEALKLSFIDSGSTEKNKCSQTESKGAESSLQRVPSLNRISGFAHDELRTLSKSTIKMKDALEIGEVAEQYLAEGNYVLALEKYQSCLSILVPLLGKEPPGRRRDLLHKQIQFWMKEAESTKGLLAIKDIQDATQRSTESYEQCVLQ